MRTKQQGAHACLAFHENVAVIIWGRETEVVAVRSIVQDILAAGAGWPAGGGLVTIVESTAEPPSAAARAELARLLHEVGRFVRRSALIQEGAGFRAAMVRAVVTGLSLLAKQTYPHRVFDTTEAALPWLVSGLPPLGGRTVAPYELATAIRQAREEFDARRRGA